MESVSQPVSVWLKRRETSATKVCARHADPHRGPGLVHTAEGHMARDLGVLGGMSRGHPGACVHSHRGRSHRRLDGDPSPWAEAPPRLPLPSALPALCAFWLLFLLPAAQHFLSVSSSNSCREAGCPLHSPSTPWAFCLSAKGSFQVRLPLLGVTSEEQ